MTSIQSTTTITVERWELPETSIPSSLDDLFDILEKFEEEKDPLSLELHRCSMKGVVDPTENFKTLQELLLNVFDDKKSPIKGDVMLDEDGWLWGREVLEEYLYIRLELGLDSTSPFTNKPFKAELHPFASALASWLNSQPESTPQGHELTLYRGSSEETRQILQLKNLVYLSHAKKAVYRKKFKMMQQPLMNSIAKTNNSTLAVQSIIANISEQARQNEERRTELTERQLTLITQTSEATGALVRAQLEDMQKSLQLAIHDQDSLKQEIAILEEQRALSLIEQQRLKEENEAKIHERLSGIEKIYQESMDVNTAKTQDIKQNVDRLTEAADLQEKQLAHQAELVKKYEVELGQIRAKAHDQELQISRMQRKIKHMQNWPI